MRLVALAYALVSVVSISPQLIINPESSAFVFVGTAGFTALIATFVVTYLRGRPFLAEPFVTAGAMFAAGISLADPYATIALALAAVATQSLYGSVATAVIRWLAVSVALPWVISASPAADARFTWHSPTLLGALPGIALILVLMRVLLATLTRQAQVVARIHLLVRSGTELLNLSDLREVRAVTAATAEGLCRQAPGVGAVLVSLGSDVVVTGVAAVPGLATGTRLPLELVGQVAHNGDQAGWLPALDPLVGRRRWRVVTMDVPDDRWLLLLGARRRVPDDVLYSFQMLASQRSQAEIKSRNDRELATQARYDSLTGLANRAEFLARLNTAMAGGATDPGVALVIIDMDDFKLVNDTYGHLIGDQLLLAVADRMRKAVEARVGQSGLPARLGGDEFAVLVVGADARQLVPRLAQDIHELLHQPLHLRDTTVFPRASIGLAVGEPARSAEDLLRCADIAMYRAKVRGKSQVAVYTAAEHGDVLDLRLLEEELGRAVEQGEIVVHYQAVIDVNEDRCVGVEALARWQHPTRGLLMPSVFIPIAERTGHISEIGAHVLTVACQQAAAWTSRPGMDHLRLSVNVARRQLLDGTLAGLVRATLARTGLPADRLTLELTESEAIADDVAIRQVTEVAGLGVSISIDDFGTGRTSLSLLSAFPVSQIKIDRSFVEHHRDQPAEAMLQLVISASQIFDLETVAEGVETTEQADYIRLIGVPLAQGFLFARPMNASDFEAWCGQSRPPAGPGARTRWSLLVSAQSLAQHASHRVKPFEVGKPIT